MQLLIGTESGDHVIFDVGTVDYTDGCDWVPCTLDIAAGAWRGTIDVSLVSRDFAPFRTQLQSLYDTLDGSARFDTTERQIELECTANNLGHITVSGIIDDQICDGNRLTFSFSLDQSYFPAVISQLRAIEATFKPYPPVA